MSEMDHRLGSRYLLKERLGRGAMGTVWRATNTDTDADVAVKVLSEELSDEPEMVARFIQERNALVAVRHPNLVRIHDLVVEDGRLAIIMDLIPGPDLHRFLAERGVLGLADAAVIARGVAGALEAIHQAGIIHRDLKPANILLDLSGPQPVPKLVDFGISRMLSGSRLTARSSVVGTPQYLSPEAISGAEPSPAVDIYAFGIALYELLTGKPPFDSDQLLQVLNQHMYQEPPWPASIPPQILPLLQAMLAKNPQARPGAADVVRTVDALLAAGPGALAAIPAPAQPAQPAQPAGGAQAGPVPGQAGYAPAPALGPGGQPAGTPVPQQSPYPAPYVTPQPGTPGVPQQPTPTPYPGAGTPLPAPYGRPPGTPVPSPSPSGFFYPNAAMFEPSQGTPLPTGEAPFTPSPPPFTDEMLTPKKKRGNRKGLLIGGGGVVGVAAVVGIVFALSGSGGGTGPAAAGTPTAKHTATAGATATGPTASVSPSCSAPGKPAPVADWPLNGTSASCTSGVQKLNLFGGASYTSSSHGTVLKFNGHTARATLPLGSLLNTAHSFSVSAWVDLQSQPKSTMTVVAFQGKETDAFELRYDSAAKSWAFGRSSADLAGPQWVTAADPKPALTHAWTHLVGIYNSDQHTMILYVNGAPVGIRSGVSGWQATGKITLGASLDPTGNPHQDLDGDLNDVQVFSSALTLPQVEALK